jgi:hypothetical protein
MVRFFFSHPAQTRRLSVSSSSSAQQSSFCSSPVAQSPPPMATPTELAGDQSGGETGRSGDHDPTPHGFVVDSFSQVADAARAPRRNHGVAGGRALGGSAPWQARRDGLPPGERGMRGNAACSLLFSHSGPVLHSVRDFYSAAEVSS